MMAWMGSALQSLATTHSYRYHLVTNCGLDKYVGDLVDAPNSGQRFDIELDAQGRQVRLTKFQDGVVTSEQRYQYAGDKRVPDGYAVVVHGKTNELVELTWADNCMIKRLDHLTADKQLSDYFTYEQMSNRVQELRYDSHDSLRVRALMFFNANGILFCKRIAEPFEEDKFVEVLYDEATGLETSSVHYMGKERQGRSECLYNAWGNLVSRTEYNKANQNTGGADYSAGLMTNRWFAERGNHILSFRYSYNENRMCKETKVCQDGKCVCVLTYERMSNGVPKRTFAKSPSGELWAEYAAEAVSVIFQNGKPLQPAKVKFYKTGPWW